LEQEFGGVISAKLIKEIAEELSGVSLEWSGKPEYDDYDDTLLSATESNRDTLQTFTESLATVLALLALETPSALAPAQHRLLFADIIAALETFLCDTVMNAVLRDEDLLERFVEANPDFAKQQVPFNLVLKEAANVRERVKVYLLDVVWHNLSKVSAIYGDTMQIKFGKSLKPIAAAIRTRHDIVHRNGKTKDGNPIELSADDVRTLAADASVLAKLIATNIPQLPF
jgi:hypothetical protein